MQNTKVRSLEEELLEEGLDPAKVLGAIERNINALGYGPSPRDASGMKADSNRKSKSHEQRSLLAEGKPPSEGEPLDEGLRASKMQSKTARKRARTGSKRAGYIKKLRKNRRYAATHASKIKRTATRRIRKAGGLSKYRARAAKAHAQTRRLSQGVDSIANLREELESTIGTSGDYMSPMVDATINAGLLCMNIGLVFEALGDEESASALCEVSDYAAQLADDLEAALVNEDVELTEEQEDRLRRLMEASTKALSGWESIGCLGLDEAIEEGCKGKGKMMGPEAEAE